MFKIITIAVSTLAAGIASAAETAGPSDGGARNLAVMVYSADLCQITITPAMKEWTSAMLKDVPELKKNAYRGLALQVQVTSEDGPIGFCYKLRSELFRDGWIAR